ncbi:MAG: hypothetical protein HWE14_10435 [Flavobacteriia bacterium]|nr:hypothetical protein [Flavobacteriia bacterium]
MKSHILFIFIALFAPTKNASAQITIAADSSMAEITNESNVDVEAMNDRGEVTISFLFLDLFMGSYPILFQAEVNDWAVEVGVGPTLIRNNLEYNFLSWGADVKEPGMGLVFLTRIKRYVTLSSYSQRWRGFAALHFARRTYRYEDLNRNVSSIGGEAYKYNQLSLAIGIRYNTTWGLKSEYYVGVGRRFESTVSEGPGNFDEVIGTEAYWAPVFGIQFGF